MSQPTQDILLCPGQGAQYVGMGKPWFDASPAARQTFEEADRILGQPLARTCFEGPEDVLNRTDTAQAAIYVTCVACHRALTQQGKINQPAATAGLSLGEFTALHLAGAFDFAAGLKLVQLRGRAMQDAADAVAGGSGMVALVGAEEAQAQELCAKSLAGLPNAVLVSANFNCPGQIVISGSSTACQKSLEVAQAMGLRATALKVAGAFHSPLMLPAAQRLAQALEQTAWSQPAVPVVSNVTATPHDARDLPSIKNRLVEQLTHPVRWTQSVQWLAKNVTGRYVELAPGKVLSGLMRRIDRELKVTNFDQPET